MIIVLAIGLTVCFIIFRLFARKDTPKLMLIATVSLVGVWAVFQILQDPEPVTTREIMRRRINDGPGAVSQYKTQTIRLKGIVQRVNLNYEGDAVLIVLNGYTPDSDVRCRVPGRPVDVMALQPGQAIQIEGEGFIAGIKMGSFETCRFVATVNHEGSR